MESSYWYFFRLPNNFRFDGRSFSWRKFLKCVKCCLSSLLRTNKRTIIQIPIPILLSLFLSLLPVSGRGGLGSVPIFRGPKQHDTALGSGPDRAEPARLKSGVRDAGRQLAAGHGQFQFGIDRLATYRDQAEGSSTLEGAPFSRLDRPRAKGVMKMGRGADTVSPEVFAVQRLASPLLLTLPNLHATLHQSVEIVRLFHAHFPGELAFSVDRAEDQPRVAFLRHPESESGYPPRQPLFGTSRFLPLLFREHLIQRFLPVPHAPFLDRTILQDLRLQVIAGATLASRVEFARVVVLSIVIPDEQHVAKNVVLVFLLEAATRRPATSHFLDLDRREILQLGLYVLETGAGESYWNRGVFTVHQLVVRWAEVQILLTPRRRRVITGASVMSPYSAFDS